MTTVDDRYKANWCWASEDSMDGLLYEFANAKTEEYRKAIYDCIKSSMNKREIEARIDELNKQVVPTIYMTNGKTYLCQVSINATIKRLDELKEQLRKTEEESDSGTVFRPVYISSCRCLITKKINKILSELESWCQEGDNNA